MRTMKKWNNIDVKERNTTILQATPTFIWSLQFRQCTEHVPSAVIIIIDAFLGLVCTCQMGLHNIKWVACGFCGQNCIKFVKPHKLIFHTNRAACFTQLVSYFRYGWQSFFTLKRHCPIVLFNPDSFNFALHNAKTSWQFCVTAPVCFLLPI